MKTNPKILESIIIIVALILLIWLGWTLGVKDDGPRSEDYNRIEVQINPMEYCIEETEFCTTDRVEWQRAIDKLEAEEWCKLHPCKG